MMLLVCYVNREEVTENESRDKSVHFVRWIKSHRNKHSTTRNCASIVQNSKRTLRLASSPCSVDELRESILEDEDSVESITSITDTWQGLKDVDADPAKEQGGCSPDSSTISKQASEIHQALCGGNIA